MANCGSFFLLNLSRTSIVKQGEGTGHWSTFQVAVPIGRQSMSHSRHIDIVVMKTPPEPSGEESKGGGKVVLV